MRDDFTKFSTVSQWFQTRIHPGLMQRQILFPRNYWGILFFETRIIMIK
ncbi:MAG: hypothetical protein HRU34_19785 [Richelia sp.]|nr:hypothetical protein [Richelia sp.]